MHLHQLHDWLSSLDVAVSSVPSGFSWSLAVVCWQSEGLALLLFLLFLHEAKLVELIVVECADIALITKLKLIDVAEVLLLSTAQLVQIEMCTIQESVWVPVWCLLVAQVASIFLRRSSSLHLLPLVWRHLLLIWILPSKTILVDLYWEMLINVLSATALL